MHDENHPDVHAMLRGVRGVLDSYPERMTVGEVYLMDPAQVARYYGRGDELHLAFNFSFLRASWEAERFAHEIERMEELLRDVPGGWPTLVLSNHDVSRHASRYDPAPGEGGDGEARARLAAMMTCTLRGTPFLYYGEEIGMRDVAVPEERMRDPLAATLHPKLSRDPERTPMQWEPGPGAGFSDGEPWLPIAADAGARNVAAQRADPGSLLHLYRSLLALRRRSPALHAGTYRRLEAPADVLAFERRCGDDRALVALSFAAETRRVDLPGAAVREGLSTDAARARPATAGRVELGPEEGLVVRVAPDGA